MYCRYLPESCVNHPDHLSQKARHEINTVNVELVKKLKATDTAFTLGKLQMEVISVLESIVYIDLNWIHFYRQKTYRDYYCSCLLFTPVIKSNCPD